MTWKRKLITGILWVLALGAGLAGLFALWQDRDAGAREAVAGRWASAQGKLVWATVRPVRRHWPLRPVYARRINYSYVASGIYYTNTRYSFDGDATFPTRAQAEAAAPAEGGSLTVYYDPLHPENAVADRERHAFARSSRFNTLLMALALAEGALLILGARLIRPRREPAASGITRP